MKRVLVILSSYNGEKYIQEQIDSILNQKNIEIVLVIRDDGSKDSTPDIIKRNAKLNKNIFYVCGENIGFRRSFYDTLLSVSNIYDYYAFSDQDDIWDEDKLFCAVNLLDKSDNELKLYASGLRVVDQNLNFMYNNTFDKLKIEYGSAISRQRIAGCTMVFNNELLKRCQKFKITPDMGSLFSHDAAVYYICLACGGEVVFESESHINFRRHEGTVTEHGKGMLKRIWSVINIFSKFRNRRYNQVLMLLEMYKNDMPKDVLELSNKIVNYKKTIKNTISLIIDKRIECGIKSIDLINKLAILFHCY